MRSHCLSTTQIPDDPRCSYLTTYDDNDECSQLPDDAHAVALLLFRYSMRNTSVLFYLHINYVYTIL